MKVYRYLNASERSVYVTLRDESDFRQMESLDGSVVIGERWKPLQAGLERSFKSGKQRQYTDFPPFLPHVPAVTGRAVLALGEDLARYGELLPLECDDCELYLYNITALADALDEELTEWRYLGGSSTRVIHRPAFLESRVPVDGFFKMPHLPGGGGVHLTESTLQRVLSTAGLQGFRYELVWDSEMAPTRRKTDA